MLGGLLPIVSNSNKGLMTKTSIYNLVGAKKYKIYFNNTSHVFNSVVFYLYAIKDGVSSYYVATLSGYRNGYSIYKIVCGCSIGFRLYMKLNSNNIFDFIIETPSNSSAFIEIKSSIDLSIIETTESLDTWSEIQST